MGSVPNLLKQRWASQQLVGAAAHSCLVRVRQGYINHLYQATHMLSTSPDADPQQFPTIWKGNNATPWQGQWVPTGDWITLTNVQSANWSRAFLSGSSSGGSSSTLTVVIDNIAYLNTEGDSGLYHTIDRGWFSPSRGVKVAGRPSLWAENAWDDVFNGGYQIELWEGYGQGSDVALTETDSIWSSPSASRTWVGLIEGCDMESNPDHITLTATDYAVLFTDQRLMGQNKATEIQSPVTFADRGQVLGKSKEFGNVSTSSGANSSDARLGAIWSSAAHGDDAHTEWVQIEVPAGFYESFYAALPYDGETMYISVYATAGSKMDGAPISAGWVNVGMGTVPSTGTQYIAVHENTVSNPSRQWSLGGQSFFLQAGSLIRLSFTNLSNDIDQIPVTGAPSGDAYRAGVNSFYVFKYGNDPTTVATSGGTQALNWVLVDDAADVVRIIALWAGFHEFEIQDFGWTLEQPLSFGQDSFLIDVINAILAQGNYVFFIDAPTDHDMSLGVPVFVPQKATTPPPANMLVVQDTQLAEAIQPVWDYSDVPYVLRYRGAVSPNGTTLFQDLTKRFTGTYWPPWSGHDYTNLQGRNFKGGYPTGRVGGVRRHFSQTDPALGSVAECLFACILTTIQYALQAVTASIQAPGLPGVTLNQQVSVKDVGTGTNSRMWIASVESDHTLGMTGAWHMTLGGSLVDTEDMNLISEDYLYTYERYVTYKAGQ